MSADVIIKSYVLTRLNLIDTVVIEVRHDILLLVVNMVVIIWDFRHNGFTFVNYVYGLGHTCLQQVGPRL